MIKVINKDFLKSHSYRVARITGDVDLAQIMFTGVRVGGGTIWKKSYSWAFGRS